MESPGQWLGSDGCILSRVFFLKLCVSPESSVCSGLSRFVIEHPERVSGLKGVGVRHWQQVVLLALGTNCVCSSAVGPFSSLGLYILPHVVEGKGTCALGATMNVALFLFFFFHHDISFYF